MTVTWRSTNLNWTLECKRDQVGPSLLYKADYLIAVSLRNKSFSNDWIISVANEIQKFAGKIHLTLVDTPYFQVATAYGYSPDKLEKSVMDLKRQRGQQIKRLMNIIEELEAPIVWHEWDFFAARTNRDFHNELIIAFSESTIIREHILAQVKKVYPTQEDEETLVKLANFFMSEIPVLADIYYNQLPGVIDVYPGPQAEFFWNLDCNKYSQELPLLSRLAANSIPHTYIEAVKNE